jgi:hypothetical protein
MKKLALSLSLVAFLGSASIPVLASESSSFSLEQEKCKKDCKKACCAKKEEGSDKKCESKKECKGKKKACCAKKEESK